MELTDQEKQEFLEKLNKASKKKTIEEISEENLWDNTLLDDIEF